MTGSHATARNFLTLLAALLIVRGPVAADEAGTESAGGRRPAAHDPLQARQTCQIVQHRQGERWLLYLGRLNQLSQLRLDLTLSNAYLYAGDVR